MHTKHLATCSYSFYVNFYCTGAFGKVHKGLYTKGMESIDIAIKTLRGNNAIAVKSYLVATSSIRPPHYSLLASIYWLVIKCIDFFSNIFWSLGWCIDETSLL